MRDEDGRLRRDQRNGETEKQLRERNAEVEGRVRERAEVEAEAAARHGRAEKTLRTAIDEPAEGRRN